MREHLAFYESPNKLASAYLFLSPAGQSVAFEIPVESLYRVLESSLKM